MAPQLLIPWFKLTPWVPLETVPWLRIQPFGVLAAVAILVGAHFLQRRAAVLGVSQEQASGFITFTTAWGLAGAYLLNPILYDHELVGQILADPSILTRRWLGLSSYGSFLAGTLAGVWYSRRKGISLLKLADTWCFAIPFAWFFARMGCFVVHDHPGVASDFLFAVDDYNGLGVARHDLGLYEVMWSAAVAGLFHRLAVQADHPAGTYLCLLPLLYGPYRFLLDFLRAAPDLGGDVRYAGLTPGQYFSVVLTVVGLALIRRHQRRLRAWTA